MKEHDMGSPDPIEALGIGLGADHKAEKQKRGKKTPAQEVAQDAGEKAKAEATDAGSTSDEAQALATVVEEKVEAAVEAQPEPIVEPTEAAVVPPAPGEDAESVFDRRLARLTTLVEEAEFEGGTAFGDLRDCVLDLFKHRPKLWSAMPPSEQQELIRHVEALAKQILEKVVLVIAQEDDVTIQATLLPAFNVKGESIEAKIKIEHVDDEGVLDVYRLAGHKVVVIDAASKRFMSARRTQDPGKDQADLPFASGPAPAAPRVIETPQPYTGDNADLADGADDEVDEDEKAEASGDDWGVFDTDRGEWLIDEAGGDEGWTQNSGDAGRWSHDKAKELATDFADGGEGVVARQLGDDPAPAATDEDRTHDETSAVND